LRDVGVDLERKDRSVNARGLSRRFFSPEEAAALGKLTIARLRERFFLYWTLKEVVGHQGFSGGTMPGATDPAPKKS